MEQRKIVEAMLDYIFGLGVGKALKDREVSVEYSKKTGRMKHIYVDGKLLATLRPDGGLALTLYGAQMLLRSKTFKENCVTVSREAEEYIRLGKSVFAKHVRKVGKRVRPSSEVAILSVEGKLLAVGRAVLSAKMMKSFDLGVAVKVRASVGAEQTGNA
ncbi:MAG: PUA domain-containing protein [Nitrososphaerales archaeon]